MSVTIKFFLIVFSFTILHDMESESLLTSKLSSNSVLYGPYYSLEQCEFDRTIFVHALENEQIKNNTIVNLLGNNAKNVHIFTYCVEKDKN